MQTIGPDPDTPDPADRTMERLELAGALDEVFPQWRDALGDQGRTGTLVGTASGPGPAGVLLGGEAAIGWAKTASPLAWFSTRRYLVLRTPQAPQLWVRALPAFPVSFQPDAALWTREINLDGEVPRWQLLHADDEPVQLATPGGQVEPWVLRGDECYDLDHDVEAGWQVFGHPEPDGAV